MTDNEIAIKVVSKVTGLTATKILSASRKWPEVEARMLIIRLLFEDGLKDEHISCSLKRCRIAIYRARQRASEWLSLSMAFRMKYDRAKKLYEQEKSLRIA